MDRQSLIGLNHFKEKAGILVIEAQTPQKANEITSEILEKYSDSKTALFLSGGKTPIHLFKAIAVKKCLKTGAVLMVDERFGEKLHKKSNELMIKNTGLLDYFEGRNVRFYPILQEDESLENTSLQYDETLRFVFKFFPKTAGILGIGRDSHTAGIPANPDVVRKMIEDQSSLVSYYELEGYGKRITMNFQALSMLDLIVILVLGQEKREALKLMFDTNKKVEEVPARFYLKPEIAGKVILITDQIV
ncbi:MAG: hypothetical protein US51_C0003G0018 [Microgenomates group bacterium GW2011_GWA2_37_6]|nr:MAG: hypothetical protein US51_C0003G0018 [Microgenomates group bacterium GW2011_GWA2_37_6]